MGGLYSTESGMSMPNVAGRMHWQRTADSRASMAALSPDPASAHPVDALMPLTRDFIATHNEPRLPSLTDDFAALGRRLERRGVDIERLVDRAVEVGDRVLVGIGPVRHLAEAPERPGVAVELDGDRVHAVVKGTALNHGGHTSGYTVPDPAAQAEVISRKLAR